MKPIQNLTTRAINGSDDICYIFKNGRKYIRITRISTTYKPKYKMTETYKYYPYNQKNASLLNKKYIRLTKCGY